MAFGSFNSNANTAPMVEINVIPLVDIMLVLLVIFIITAPLLTHSVKIDLPRATSQPHVTRMENIQLAVDGAGRLFWNGEPVTHAQMIERMTAAGAQQPAPELHLHVDQNARYAPVADALSAAARAGLSRIGFVTDPAMP
ncbi:MAG: biopolymer transporter ExbD [Nevskiales bacterium]|nr:biopolymer transporter ExbD [Nevskiales bacterium]